MFEAFTFEAFNFLKDKFPNDIIGWTIIGLVFVGLIVWVVWKSASFYIRTNKSINQIPNFKDTLSKIDKGLSTLNTILLEKKVIENSCYSDVNSPRQVNEKGEEVLKKSGAKELFEEIKPQLIKDLNNREFDSFLELERQAFSVILGRMEDPEFKNIQNYVYENPKFNDLPLNYSDILFLMSLKLRNFYIKENPDSNLGNK